MPNPRANLVPTPIVLGIGAVWLGAAIVAGVTGVVAKLRPPVPQLILFALTALLIVAGVKLPRFRAWLLSLDLRAVVALHLTRLVAGIAFLVLNARGELATAFAVPAGWGDILTAVLAIPVLFVPPAKPHARRLYLGWNVIGFVDILMVVVNAAVQGVRDPASMAPLLRLPLSVLPTFLVPLIIASHVLLFARLRRAGETELGSDGR
jgi:hypothetical protein